MRRGVVASICLLVLAYCDGHDPAGVPAPNNVAYPDERGNYDVSYPETWSRAKDQLTKLGSPNELLALATFRLRQGGGCAPKTALREAGSHDAIVFLVELTATRGKKPPPRPPTFEPVPDPQMNECWDTRVASYLFRDSGGRFQADVWLGDDATEATAQDAIDILDSLHFGTREDTGSFYERVQVVLEQRGFGRLRRASERDRRRAAPERELRAKVRRRLAKEAPHASLIDVTLAMFQSTHPRLGRYRKLTYVVHTGPFATGDCLDFYDAKTLHYDLGSCFLTDREL